MLDANDLALELSLGTMAVGSFVLDWGVASTEEDGKLGGVKPAALELRRFPASL